MNNSLAYKGYRGVVEFSAADNVFFGKLFGINDLVTFEGTSVKALEKSFREAVDDYLATCAELGKEPERIFKGSFNVRIDPDIHRKAALKAQTQSISLNELIEKAIKKEVDDVHPGAPERWVPRLKPVSSVRKSPVSKGRAKRVKNNGR